MSELRESKLIAGHSKQSGGSLQISVEGIPKLIEQEVELVPKARPISNRIWGGGGVGDFEVEVL